jgi:hypothetical protein
MGKFLGNCPRREAGLWGLSAVIPVLWMFTVLVGFPIVGLQVLCIAESVVMVPGEVEGERNKMLGEQRAECEREGGCSERNCFY